MQTYAGVGIDSEKRRPARDGHGTSDQTRFSRWIDFVHARRISSSLIAKFFYGVNGIYDALRVARSGMLHSQTIPSSIIRFLFSSDFRCSGAELYSALSSFSVKE